MTNFLYFKRTRPDFWVLQEAIKEAMEKEKINFHSATDKIRSILNSYENNISKEWKENWKAMIEIEKKAFMDIPSSSRAVVNHNHKSAVNNFNCENVTNNVVKGKKRAADIVNKSEEEKKFKRRQETLTTEDPFNYDEVYIDPEETEKEEVEDDYENDAEDDIIEPIPINEDIIINNINIVEKINNWIKSSKYIKKIEEQDLLRYNIIDFTPDSSSVIKALIGQEWDSFQTLAATSKYFEYIDNNLVENNISSITSSCRTLKSLAFSYKEKKNYFKEKNEDLLHALKIVKIFTKLKIRKTNRITDKKQTETGYIIHFVAPIICDILEKQEYFDLIWGESVLKAQQIARDNNNNDSIRRSSATKLDLKIDIVDDVNTFIINFSILEVSGPPHVKNYCHYKKDKKKIGKSLKFMLNQLYLKYPGEFEAFKKIKLFGLQIYNNNFYVYSLCLVHPRLYSFQLEAKFLCPTSGLEICNIPTFVMNLLQVKKNHMESLETVLSYIETRDEKKKNDTIITNENMSPGKK